MSWLVNLFYNPEKICWVMEAHYPIPTVVSIYRASSTIAQWRSSFTSQEYSSPHRLTDLESCDIVSVAHYRQKGSLAHEIIVLHMLSEKDERFIRLELFKLLPEDWEEVWGLNQITREVLRGTTADNHGSVKSVFRLAIAVGTDYELVQEFSIRKKLDIIHAAALASSITQLAHEYSVFHHMCMQWASTYFAVAHSMAGDPPCQEGPGFAKRGKIYGLRLVDDNCRLVVPNGPGVTIDSMITTISDNMRKARVDAVLIQNLVSSLKKDYSLLSSTENNDFMQSPISTAKMAAAAASNEIRAILSGLVDDAIRKRDINKLGEALLQVKEAEAQLAAAKAQVAELQQQIELHQKKIVL